MNSTIKSQWITALRSGDYKQGRGWLRQDNAYCCLGVLCDLHRIHQGGDSKANPDDCHSWRPIGRDHCYSYGDGKTRYSDPDTVLPNVVQRWAGLDCSNPDIVADDNSITLAQLNDEGDTFEEIAQRIEEHF